MCVVWIGSHSLQSAGNTLISSPAHLCCIRKYVADCSNIFCGMLCRRNLNPLERYKNRFNEVQWIW